MENRTSPLLTGRYRFRKGWRGRLVLQVQESYRYQCSESFQLGPKELHWRDAGIEDISVLGPLYG